jgi:HK97 family phage major capsid protein
MSEISAIVEKVTALDAQISKAFTEGDADKATMKAKLKELSEGLAGLSKAQERSKQVDQPCHVFGTKSVARDFMDFLATGPLQKVKSLNPGKASYSKEWESIEQGAFTKDKGQDLYQSVNGGAPAPSAPGSNGSGGYLVPTTVDTVLWQLILQGFEARKLLTVREVVGNFALPVATNQAKSYFVGADNSTMTETDFAGGVSGQQPFQPNVTVSPATIGAYMNVSSKLLYNSAVDLSTYVAQNLAVSAGLLEDLMTIWGDGTSTWGLQTGLFTAATNAGQVITTSTASATIGDTLIPLDDAVTASGHAKFSIDDLVNMRTKAFESVDGNGCYFMQREVWAYFCALKADNGTYGSLLYYLNPYTQGRVTPQGMVVGDINGVPVILWNRLSTGKYSNGAIFSGTAGTSPAGDWGQVAMTNNSVYPCVIYGDLKKAATLVFNRNMFIDVDRSIRFLQGEYTWRIIEDVGVGCPLPKAMSILAVTAIGS